MTGSARIHGFVLLAALVLISGCAPLLGGGKPDNLYRFGVPVQPESPVEAALPAPRPAVLARVRFAPEIEGDRILTARGQAVLYIKDARWAAPAPDLFSQAVIGQFDRRAPGIRLVPSGERVGSAHAFLRLSIDRFEARYTPGEREDAPPRIIVAGSASLADPDSSRPIIEQRFWIEEPASANSQSAIAAAFDQAVSRYTTQLADWCVRAMAPAQ